MSNDTEFREELKRIIRHTDPEPQQLRSAASDLETLADRWDEAEEVL